MQDGGDPVSNIDEDEHIPFITSNETVETKFLSKEASRSFAHARNGRCQHGAYNLQNMDAGGTGAAKSDREAIGKSSNSNTAAKRSLIIACAFCLCFMIAQAIGGYAAGSLAVMTDAAHLLSDLTSFLISLFSLCLSTRPPSHRMTFGWHRAEVLGAFGSICMIWIVTGIFLYAAIGRLAAAQFDINAELMLITAGIGVVFNIIMAVILHKGGDAVSHAHSHGHSHSHSHSHSRGTEKSEDEIPIKDPMDQTELILRKRNTSRISIRAALLHVLSDFLQSFAVLSAAIAIYCKPSLAVLDPVCTFSFSILVLATTCPVLVEIITVLMEGAPKSINHAEVVETLQKIDGVKRVDNVRIWSLNTDRIAATARLLITNEYFVSKYHAVLSEVRHVLLKRFSVHECIIQIEPHLEGVCSHENGNACNLVSIDDP